MKLILEKGNYKEWLVCENKRIGKRMIKCFSTDMFRPYYRVEAKSLVNRTHVDISSYTSAKDLYSIISH